EPTGMAFPIIHFDATGNAIAILPHALIAFAHDGEDLLPFPFEYRAHRIQTVRHSALVDDVQRAGDIFAHDLPLTQWGHTEFQQDHELPFFDRYALPLPAAAVAARSSSH